LDYLNWSCEYPTAIGRTLFRASSRVDCSSSKGQRIAAVLWHNNPQQTKCLRFPSVLERSFEPARIQHKTLLGIPLRRILSRYIRTGPKQDISTLVERKALSQHFCSTHQTSMLSNSTDITTTKKVVCIFLFFLKNALFLTLNSFIRKV
jgi:hypothetical protein